MTKQKKLIIICSAVVATFLIACVVMGIVFGVRRNAQRSGTEGWKSSTYTAQSTIGKIEVNYTEFVSKIKVNSEEIRVEREESQESNCGSFEYADTEYYIVLVGKGEDMVAFLYYGGDEPQFVEKLVCMVNNG